MRASLRRSLWSALVAVAAAALAFAGWQMRTAAAVATGYAAKLTCSLSLVSGQPPERISHELLEQALWPVGSFLRMQPADCCARAGLFGLASSRAVWRKGFGCTLLAGRDEKDLSFPEAVFSPAALDRAKPWPEGDAVLPVFDAATRTAIDASVTEAQRAAVAAAIDSAFREPPPSSGQLRQTKAVLVAHRGRLLAERYADGIDASTAMISWSMAKSVTAALVGIAVADGRLDLQAPAPVPEWSDPSDARHAITLDELLHMSSGLRFDETYGAVNDVSRMLFTQADAAGYAARSPLAAAPGSLWSYSSGTTNIVARLLEDAVGGDISSFARFARERLFEPAAMTSAFFEYDAAGHPLGSSFVFMTARDWARFGELHRNDGMAGGRRLLPEGWVRYVTTPAPRAPDARYGAHWWLNGSAETASSRRPWPALPPDAFAARGYAGQWLLVVPSRELVLVRLGVSFPDDGEDGSVELAASLLELLPH